MNFCLTYITNFTEINYIIFYPSGQRMLKFMGSFYLLLFLIIYHIRSEEN